VSHLGYEYDTKFNSYVTYTYSDGCDSTEEEWETYRKKSDSSESLLFRRITEPGQLSFELKQTHYFNLDKILTSVKEEYGRDILLGDLTGYFPLGFEDCAIFDVYKLGAAEILKNNLESSNEMKEAAAQNAAELLIKKGMKEEKAKSIINDFTSTLGWVFKIVCP